VFTFEYKVEECEFAESQVNGNVELQSIAPRDSNGEQLYAQPEIQGTIKNPRLVIVLFGIQPRDNGERPGKYNTGFVVVDKRFDFFRQDVVTTLRYQQTWLLILTIVVPVILVGSFLVWYKGRAAGSTESLIAWIRKPANIFAIGAGIAAAFAYLNTVTFSDADFGQSLFENPQWQWLWQADWFKTVGGAGSAFVTAVLGFSLIGDRARGGTDSEGAPGTPGRFAG
jgi:hypothetical protein